MTEQPSVVVVDGVALSTGMYPEHSLTRAVVISLFSWRLADADDPHDQERFGWWGDTHPPADGDLIGSRLWLLSRVALTEDTVARARGYCQEALQWLIDDGVATSVEVTAQRVGVDRLSVRCVISRVDGAVVDLRFDDVWRSINAV